MAKTNDSGGSGGSQPPSMIEAIELVSASARRLYGMAERLKDDPDAREAIESLAADLDSRQVGLRYEVVNGSGLAGLLPVPREHVEAFRIGLMRELAQVSEWLAEQAREVQTSLSAIERPEWHPPHERPKQPFDPFECVGGPVGAVQACVGYLRQLDSKGEGDVVLMGDRHSLKHVLGAVGQVRLERHVSQVEFGGQEVIRALDIVAWAAKEAQRLDAEDAAESGEEAA